MRVLPALKLTWQSRCRDTIHGLMERGMKNATTRGKLALTLPIVGADLKDQQRPRHPAIFPIGWRTGRFKVTICNAQ